MNAGVDQAEHDGAAVLESLPNDLLAKKELYQFLQARLRHIARVAMGQFKPMAPTLQTTALLHELFLRLDRLKVKDTEHFLAVAAVVMRRILIDHARRRRKYCADVSVDDLTVSEDSDVTGLLALRTGLQQLSAEDPIRGKAIQLYYFGRLTVREVASLMRVSPRTVDRWLRRARTWLHKTLEADGRSDRSEP